MMNGELTSHDPHVVIALVSCYVLGGGLSSSASTPPKLCRPLPKTLIRAHNP